MIKYFRTNDTLRLKHMLCMHLYKLISCIIKYVFMLENFLSEQILANYLGKKSVLMVRALYRTPFY